MSPLLRGILRFEGRYQTRNLTFTGAAAFFVLAGFALAATAFGPEGVPLNSPFSIAQSLGLLSLVAVFTTTLFCARAALRDSEHRMTEILYTTAISKAQYVLGRFAGAALAAFAAFAFAVPGLLLGTYAVAHEAARVGPFDPLAYAWPLLILAAPNLLFLVAVLFGVALLTRSTIATYVGGVLLYMLYFVAALFTGSPLMASSSPPTAEGLARAALADPFGLSALFDQTRYWTAAERGERLLDVSGNLLVNRLLWIAATALLLALVYRRFAFRLPASGSARRLHVESASRAAPPSDRTSGYRPTAIDRRRRAALRAYASTLRTELRHALHSWPLLALLAGWIGTVGVELFESFRRAEFGTVLVPTTGQILGRLQLPFTLFALLLIAYYAAELVWRERAAGMAEIVDATPTPSGAFLAAKVTALALLVGLLGAVAIGVALAFQLACGVPSLEPGLYLSLLGFTGLPLVLVAVLAVLVQALAPNRHVGLLATLLLIGFWHRGALGGPDHPLLRYAAAPRVPYSALSGFGPEVLSFAWFQAYWAAFAGLLALLCAALWRRGTEPRLLPRLASLPRRLGREARLGALASAVVWLVLGGLVFHQTHRLNEYRTGEELRAWKAAYERTYRHLEREPQPTLLAVETRADLYPEERRYRVRGSYLLENRSPEPISRIWVAVRRDLARARVDLAGKPPAESDPRFGAHAFALDPPLAPGARVRLGFDLERHPRGATAGNPDYGIVRNGSFLLSTFYLPTLGYRRSYEIADPEERRRQGLPPVARPTTLEGTEEGGLSSGVEARVAFDATVSTSGDQIALAPGQLIGSWERDGRRTFHYRTEQPIRPIFALVSGRYAVTRAHDAGVDIEVYHHPGHERNVERMIAAAQRTLRFGIAQLGPYPHGTLRIVELPATWKRFAGFAAPGTVYLVEDRGFLTDVSDPARVDVVSKRVAHEVAHQWFGHQLSPVAQPGASVLVETLARYAESRVLAALQGEDALASVLAFELDRYLSGRTSGAEVPLVRVGDQPYLYYAKGNLVMAAVRDLLGEEATHRALRQLIADAQTLPPPTALDLVAHLGRGGTEPQRALLEQWWKQIVLYDLGIEEARAEALPDGRYRLTVRVAAGKIRLEGGRESPLTMDEEIEMAVLTEPSGRTGEPHPAVVRSRHRLRGATALTLLLPARPRSVVLDPGHLRIDRNRADNERKVEEVAGRQTAPAPGGSG